MAYGTAKTGQGRYALLSDYTGAQIGYAWVSDAGGIGFVPSSGTGVLLANEIRQGLTTASSAKKSAAQAFDALVARRDSIVGGTVRRGNLDLLPA